MLLEMCGWHQYQRNVLVAIALISQSDIAALASWCGRLGGLSMSKHTNSLRGGGFL